jgi:hypothetical protein
MRSRALAPVQPQFQQPGGIRGVDARPPDATASHAGACSSRCSGFTMGGVDRRPSAAQKSWATCLGVRLEIFEAGVLGQEGERYVADRAVSLLGDQ